MKQSPSLGKDNQMVTTISRRQLAGMAAATVAGFVTTGCGLGDDDSDSGGQVELRFSWWGNNDRAELTQKVIDAFATANPQVSVKGEFADFNAYFDKLATQVAGNDAPDVITLGGAYPREYGDRGALLDLAKVNDILKTDKIDQAALSNGNFSDTQYGVPTGANTAAFVADPEVFAKAGVTLPDDNIWTWDDLVLIATDIARKTPKGTYGLQDPTKTDGLDLYARQRGEGLYTPDGRVGISRQTLVDWWTMTLRLLDAGATPTAAETADQITKPAPEQSRIGRGLAGLQLDWSNQLTALRKSSGHKLVLLRAPGESVNKPGMWLQASQLYTISARSKHPRQAARFVDFLVNSPDAGKIVLTDRGLSSNSEVRDAILPHLDEDQAAQAEFITKAAPKMGPALVIGPTGSTQTPDILDRINAEVLFKRWTPKKAAEEFIKQVTAAIS